MNALPLPPRNRIIDMHCHAAGIGSGQSGCMVSPQLRRSFRFRFYLQSFGVTEQKLMREGDGIVITRIAEQIQQSRYVGRAVVLAMDGVVTRQGDLDLGATEIQVPNEFVAEEVAKHPNLLFGASVHPYRKDALDRLDWCRAHGAVLIKWLPAIQGINPSDTALKPYYRRLAELRLPLLTHTGSESSFTRVDNELSDPDHLRLALQCGVTVIAAHVATGGHHQGQRAIDRLARLTPEFPRLYADISALTQPNKIRYLREVVTRPEFRNRLIFGTDYPLTNIPALVSPWYHLPALGLAEVKRILRHPNCWDRDVALKHTLHFPNDVWTRAEHILANPNPSKCERIHGLDTR